MASSLYRRAVPSSVAARRALSSVSRGSRSRSCGGSTPVVAAQWPLEPSQSSISVAGAAHGSAGVVLGNGRRLGTFSASFPRRDEYVMNLPGMGDSISEGTVVQWCKSVGDEVAEDEVIAVVETDKVSVDVKSTHVGVVVKLFAAVDDVLEVGKPLCTIDGDEASVVRAKIEAAQEEEDSNAPPPEVKKPNLEDAYAGAFMAGADFVAPKKSRHEPLIKFVGKRDHSKRQQDTPAASDVAARHRHSPGALDFSQIVGGAKFGRPIMSEEEMDAVDSGGAEIAPQLRYIDGSRWAS